MNDNIIKELDKIKISDLSEYIKERKKREEKEDNEIKEQLYNIYYFSRDLIDGNEEERRKQKKIIEKLNDVIEVSNI